MYLVMEAAAQKTIWGSGWQASHFGPALLFQVPLKSRDGGGAFRFRLPDCGPIRFLGASRRFVVSRVCRMDSALHVLHVSGEG